MSTSPNRLLATVFGIVYVLIGIAGFFVTSGVGFFDTSGGLLLGIFEVNIFHNVAHIADRRRAADRRAVRRAAGQDRQLGRSAPRTCCSVSSACSSSAAPSTSWRSTAPTTCCTSAAPCCCSRSASAPSAQHDGGRPPEHAARGADHERRGPRLAGVLRPRRRPDPPGARDRLPARRSASRCSSSASPSSRWGVFAFTAPAPAVRPRRAGRRRSSRSSAGWSCSCSAAGTRSPACACCPMLVASLLDLAVAIGITVVLRRAGARAAARSARRGTCSAWAPARWSSRRSPPRRSRRPRRASSPCRTARTARPPGRAHRPLELG